MLDQQMVKDFKGIWKEINGFVEEMSEYSFHTELLLNGEPIFINFVLAYTTIQSVNIVGLYRYWKLTGEKELEHYLSLCR